MDVKVQSMNSASTDPDVDGTIDLRAILARLWARRVWLLACTFLFTAGFAAVAFIMTPIYRSSAVFVSASANRASMSGLLGNALGSFGDLAALAGVNLGSGGSETEEGLAVLKSREFTERFIADHKLLPKLFPEKWNAETHQWKPNVLEPTLAQGYKYFDRNIRTVIDDKKTGLITMQIDWSDREEAAVWANDLLSRVNAEMRARAIQKADASTGYLEKEFNTTTVVATRDAISRLLEAQIKQRMLANVTDEYAFRVVDRALPPDKIDKLKPHKLLMIVSGFALGAVIGVLGALLADAWNRGRVSSVVGS
jgi:uncharacterized protein involved in exopolysaccharide biosynthesis